tara:strand:+ start:28588 stop:28866 length:279 start_codon:yes stop_codon:yes gene_type:complete
MPRKRKIIDKQSFKKSCGKCLICGEDNYDLLDVHRIVPGSEGGRYTKDNSVTLCSNCHRRVHAGEIDIHRYYNSTAGTVLHVTLQGEEKFLR